MSNAPKLGLLLICLALALGGLAGCAVIGNVGRLDDDHYRLVRRESPDSLVAALHAGRQFYVQQRADTLLLTPPSSADAPLTYRYRLQPNERVLLLRRRLDLDVFTIPFKVRPPRGGVPVQLNTNFNAAIYVGRRLDFYSLRTKRSTPFGATPHIRATGIGYGAFVGAGSTIVNPDVTRQRANIAEYEGLVLHGGLAAIYDARAFNIGVAAGIDQLMGPDGPYWVYRHKPWFGVLFGLDLN
ncbi:MAG TPA: hypothetical protein VF629_05405 [Hymenobacter sp.]|jgi:hypothetical protein|uniref:hypothetical protein n=1 Tax=Hymenobacter sp. TaxID=1898978 RepID=UPI002EDB9D7B